MGVSITEILDVIKKSGLPIGDRLTKTQAELGAEDSIRAGITPLYSGQLGQVDAEKQKKIQMLAGVDKEFSGLFGKGGKYALNNPMDAEQLTAGGQQIRLSDFMSSAQQKQDLLKSLESDVSKATSLYDQVKPSTSEGADSVALADLKYINDTYGLGLPGMDTQSDWEIDTPDTDWEIDSSGNLNTPKLGGVDKMNKAQG